MKGKKNYYLSTENQTFNNLINAKNCTYKQLKISLKKTWVLQTKLPQKKPN